MGGDKKVFIKNLEFLLRHDKEAVHFLKKKSWQITVFHAVDFGSHFCLVSISGYASAVIFIYNPRNQSKLLYPKWLV